VILCITTQEMAAGSSPAARAFTAVIAQRPRAAGMHFPSKSVRLTTGVLAIQRTRRCSRTGGHRRPVTAGNRRTARSAPKPPKGMNGLSKSLQPFSLSGCCFHSGTIGLTTLCKGSRFAAFSQICFGSLRLWRRPGKYDILALR
jgi:hypothetical protein